MKISAIKQQQKRKDRYSVYAEGTYIFSLSESELLSSGLKTGQELTDAELAKLKDQATLDKAYDRALNLISHRPRSEWELSEYLKRKGLNQDASKYVLDKLRKRGYIDDLDFAQRWVHTRRLLKSTSKRRLAQELRQKHIAVSIIDQVLADDETDEREVLRDLIERKRKYPKYQDNLKLMQYLSRQGFSYEDIRTALNEE